MVAFILLLTGVSLVDYWSIAHATRARRPLDSGDDVANVTQTGVSTSIGTLVRPMAKKEWKRYIAEKYRDVIESKLRFDLVDLYTPRRVVDDDDGDNDTGTASSYQLSNAPRGFDKLYRRWESMRAEELDRREKLNAYRALRMEEKESDDEEPADTDTIRDAEADLQLDSLSKEERRLAKQQRRKE
jgi:hypothetical protein